VNGFIHSSPQSPEREIIRCEQAEEQNKPTPGPVRVWTLLRAAGRGGLDVTDRKPHDNAYVESFLKTPQEYEH
jgi:hypothetical protein